MNNKRKAEDVAADRMMLIAPLLDQGLDQAKKRALIKEIAEKSDISIRSIGRYLDAYKASGFAALASKAKSRDNFRCTLPNNWTDIVNEAILLRRELPSRSVPQIIKILEMEQFAQPGEIKRSTLQRYIQEQGYGTKQMKLYTNKGAASRRFQKKHRCELCQGDIKYGHICPLVKTVSLNRCICQRLWMMPLDLLYMPNSMILKK